MSVPVHRRLALRPATDDDRQFLARVYASTRAEEMSWVDWPEEQKTAFLQSQFDAQHHHYHAHYEGAEWYVIECDGQPAGRLYLHRRPNEIRLMDIALLPEFRGHGHGAKLVRELLAEGETTGRSVTIHVERHNRARGLYERLGFRPIAEVGVYDLWEWRPSAPPSA